jgi:hypothetical protein
MPNVTLAQIATLTKVAEKLEKLEPEVEKKFPGIKKLLEDVYDTDPSRTTVEDYAELAKKVAESVKEVEKFRSTIKEITVKAVSAAKNELLGKDAKLAQALAMVARGDKGRTGPKAEGVKQYNHIHIGGNAKSNLLFQPATKLVLGVLDFHLETGLSDSNKKKIKDVAARSGGTVTLKIDGDAVVEK